MSELQNCSYRKTDQAIPLDIIDNYTIQEFLGAMDDRENLQEVEQKVQMEPSIFKSTVESLLHLGLIERG